LAVAVIVDVVAADFFRARIDRCVFVITILGRTEPVAIGINWGGAAFIGLSVTVVVNAVTADLFGAWIDGCIVVVAIDRGVEAILVKIDRSRATLIDLCVAVIIDTVATDLFSTGVDSCIVVVAVLGRTEPIPIGIRTGPGAYLQGTQIGSPMGPYLDLVTFKRFSSGNLNDEAIGAGGYIIKSEMSG
jgi:hypothetical protein